jgi:hypothetical protein
MIYGMHARARTHEHTHTHTDHAKCDAELGETVMQSTDMEELMSKFSWIITATCDAAFKVSRNQGSRYQGKKCSVVVQ